MTSETSTQQQLVRILVQPGQLLFNFASLSQWRLHAAAWFEQYDVRSSACICVDSRGRLCPTGKEFMRAHDEGTYPVLVFLQVCE